MTTYALPISEALAAQLAEAPTERRLEAEYVAAEVLAEMLQVDADVDIENEPLDQATLDMLKEQAYLAHNGGRTYSLDEVRGAAMAAAQRGAERREQVTFNTPGNFTVR